VTFGILSSLAAKIQSIRIPGLGRRSILMGLYDSGVIAMSGTESGSTQVCTQAAPLSLPLSIAHA